jgi:hypothetical protein
LQKVKLRLDADSTTLIVIDRDDSNNHCFGGSIIRKINLA